MIARHDKTPSQTSCTVCGKMLTIAQVYSAQKRYKALGKEPVYTCGSSCGKLLCVNSIEDAKRKHEIYGENWLCAYCGTKIDRRTIRRHTNKGTYLNIYCSYKCFNMDRTRKKQIKQARTKGDNMATQKLVPLARPEITASSEGCNVIMIDNTRPEFDKIVAAFMGLSNAEKALLIHSFMPWQKLETLEAQYEDAYPTVKPILHSVKAGDKLFHPSCIEVPVESVNDKYIGVTIDSMKIVVDKHGYKTSDEKRKNRILFLNLDDYIEYAKSRGTK